MKKVIFVFVLIAGLSLSSAGFSSETINTNRNVQYKITEWVEYVLVGSQWYKITHLDSGENIIQACMGAGTD
jgi:hypothetical protein